MSQTDPNPRFSVIIPTKDRADYLRYTLRTCELQDYDNFEVIVADDGSTDHTREVVEEAAQRDPRIRYASQGASVGMRDNFEFALNQVKPGYVMALGGDDGLLPYGIRGMRDTLLETGQELLSWPAPVYMYAGARSHTGQLILHARNGRPCNRRRIVRSKDFLANQVKDLFYVADIESPMIYVKGVASTGLVDRVRLRSPGGRFYAPSTPDGYSGIVLAGEVETYAFSGMPFSMHGVSPTSAGLSYLAGSERARKQSEDFFAKAVAIPMHEELARQPYSPLIAVMTVDFLLTARDLPGWPGTFPPIDYRQMLQRALSELEDGQFAGERMTRELVILDAIAEHHGLGAFFRGEVGTRRKNLRRPLEGNAISPKRLYFDASRLGIENVYDAAFVAHYIHKAAPEFSLSTAWNFLSNSLKYRLLSFKKGAPFPPHSEWGRSTSA
ncbi:glycosyltransferase family 2 protein [Roseateles sp.]|uniref:glycosyltransferase family 2 protein n=1 Tax=Roseateles sp. TaxID=1971397 RepID=UPI003BA521D1